MLALAAPVRQRGYGGLGLRGDRPGRSRARPAPCHGEPGGGLGRGLWPAALSRGWPTTGTGARSCPLPLISGCSCLLRERPPRTALAASRAQRGANTKGTHAGR